MNRSDLRKVIIRELDALITDDAIFADKEQPGIQRSHDFSGDYPPKSSLSVDRDSPDDQGRMLDYGGSKSHSGEGKKVRQGLYHIMKDSLELYDMLEDGDDLPEWVESKIATARDRISSAVDYMDYRINRNVMKR